MSPKTLYALEEMGNATHADRAAAYLEALQKRVDNLYDFQEIATLPWYGRIWYFFQLKRLITAIRKEQKDLTRLRQTVNWNRFNDNGQYATCCKLEQIESKIIKSLNLSFLAEAHV